MLDIVYVKLRKQWLRFVKTVNLIEISLRLNKTIINVLPLQLQNVANRLFLLAKRPAYLNGDWKRTFLQFL